MNINASLFGQMITFAIFVWFTMKYVWPHIMRALDERSKKIAEGLEAAERGKRELELAQHKSADTLREAKVQAAEILDDAKHRASRIVEDSKETARKEGKQLIDLAKVEIDREKQKASEELISHVTALALAGAEKIIEKNIDANVHRDLVNKTIEEL